MKTLCLFIILLSATIHAQVILTKMVDKTSGEELIRCSSFIIDPIDSMVLSYSESGFNGETKHELLRPLRSGQFILKTCDLHQRDTMFLMNYEENKMYLVELASVKQLKWMTVYFNENGIIEYNHGFSLFNCPYKYLKLYQDSVDHYYNLKVARSEEDYKKAYNEYLKNLAWTDSVNQFNEEKMPDPPIPVQEVVEDAYYYTIAEQMFDYPGGTSLFLKKIYGLKLLRLELNKKKDLTLEFRFSGFEFQADSVIVFDGQHRVLKNSVKIWEAMKDFTQVKWMPMKLNGRIIKLRPDIGYRLEFIYRKE